VKVRSGTPRQRKVHALIGAGPRDAFGVHNSSLVNLVRGVTERVFLVDYGKGLTQPLRPERSEFRELIKVSERFLKRNAFQLGRFTHPQFIEGYSGDARKYARYKEARRSLLHKPLERSDSEIRTFTKAEKTNFTAKVDPAPRIISPRDTRFNLELGVFIKPLEGVVYKLLNKMCGGPTVMKGFNMQEVGAHFEEAWNSFGDPVGVGGDAKRFDQHTGPEALQFEARVYSAFFDGRDKRDLKRLLKWQRDSVCRGYTPEGSVKFDFDIRASGDMNTGLGTCVIACSIVHAYCVSVNLDYRLMDNGDDFVVICERADLPKLNGIHEFCKKLGYFMVMEKPVYTLEEIEFCQAHPVWDGTGYRMVRNYPTAIGKDMISVLPLQDVTAWKKWANDVGGCGIALNSGIPVLQSFYSSLCRSGEGTFGDHPWTKYSGARLVSRGMDKKVRQIAERSRYSFYLAFGLAPASQSAIESYYDDSTFSFESDLQGYSLKFLEQPTHTYHQQLFD